MEIKNAAQSLSALGHPARLGIFRLLMRFAPRGARPTEIAEALGVRQNTLSAQLAELERAGLVQATRDGRSIFYSVDLPVAKRLIDYLVNDCCRGRPEVCFARNQPELEHAMPPRRYNVLFLCSGNSARSIFAEALLRDLGGDRFHAYSAGTRPGSALNPFAVEVLERAGHATGDLRAKHLSEFQTLQSPLMDFVFTVCDRAATEDCAPWPGQPLTAHWGMADPVKAVGTDAEKGLAFARAYGEMRRRIIAFAALPIAELERVAVQTRLDDIGGVA